MRKYITLFAASLALISCTAGIEGQGSSDVFTERTFTATMVSDAPATRTSFAKDGTVYHHSWSADDQISVFVSGGVSNDCYSVQSRDGASAIFSGGSQGAAEGTHYAIYPYASGNVSDGAGHLSVTFPTQQTYASGSYGEEANVMTAVTTTRELAFQNASAYLRLALTGAGQKISSVTVRSNAGEKLSGPAIISYDDFATLGYPVAAMADAAVSSVTLTCPEPVEVSSEAVDFVLALAPVKLTGGLEIIIEDASGKSMTRSVTSELVFERNMVTPTSLKYTPDTKSTEFDEEAVVASFGIISDTHIDGTTNSTANKFVSALRQLKERAAVKDVDGLDGVLVAGDLINSGYIGAYEQTGYFKSLYEQVFSPLQVPMVYTIGNHDVYNQWTSAMVSAAANVSSRLGSDYFSTDIDTDARTRLECRHCVIKGVHVLCITPNSKTAPSAGYDPQAIAWLDNQLKAITEAEPQKYVLVLSHPMIYNTVYGSDLETGSLAWYTSSLTATLSKYPQAVTFGGHLHFPLNDPRTIMQGDFTSFGTGSTRYMAIENGGYQNMASATTMNDKDSFSQGLMLQVDKNGNVRVSRMDFYHKAVIGDYIEMQYPDPVTKTHLTRYSRMTRQAANSAPVISSIEIKEGLGTAASPVTAVINATDDEMIHHFVVTLKADGTVQWTRKYLGDFYLHPDPADNSKRRDVTLGNLYAGKQYELQVAVYDSWNASDVQSKSFTVNPSTAGTLQLYADIDFDGGTVSEQKGVVTIENKGASVAKTSVSHNGVSYVVDAVHATTGKYVMCTFNEIQSSDAMVAFASCGFCVETFYVDRKPGTAVHGIVCGTQSGGWGLATRATGRPYFIVGDGTTNTYRNYDLNYTPSTSELTHLVAVYDPGTKKILLYANGVLNGSQSINTPFFPGIGDTFNRFCLGDDVTLGGLAGDFPASDMIITDVKIYSGLMDAAAVAEKYSEAVAALSK